MPQALLALLVPMATVGCVAVRMPGWEAAADPAPDALFQPPPAVKSQLRALVATGGGELDFSLLVRARRPDELQVVALGDLGGTLFHVRSDAEGTRVVQGSPVLGDGFLVEVVAAGMAPLFLGVPEETLRAGRLESGIAALRGSRGADEVLLASAERGSTADRAWIGRGGRLAARLAVLEWRRDAAGRILHPARFRLEDGRGRTRLEARVLAWEEEAP